VDHLPNWTHRRVELNPASDSSPREFILNLQYHLRLQQNQRLRELCEQPDLVSSKFVAQKDLSRILVSVYFLAAPPAHYFSHDATQAQV
jgi:hypothetical protein